jgi:hypothetical protein
MGGLLTLGFLRPVELLALGGGHCVIFVRCVRARHEPARGPLADTFSRRFSCSCGASPFPIAHPTVAWGVTPMLPQSQALFFWFSRTTDAECFDALFTHIRDLGAAVGPLMAPPAGFGVIPLTEI